MSKSRKITIRMGRDQMDEIGAMARNERMTRPQFVREVIEATLPLFQTGTYLNEFRREIELAVEGKRPASID